MKVLAYIVFGLAVIVDIAILTLCIYVICKIIFKED